MAPTQILAFGKAFCKVSTPCWLAITATICNCEGVPWFNKSFKASIKDAPVANIGSATISGLPSILGQVR